jgi:hypothetical protein
MSETYRRTGAALLVVAKTPRAKADEPGRAPQAPAIIPTLPVSDIALPSQRLFQQPVRAAGCGSG